MSGEREPLIDFEAILVACRRYGRISLLVGLVVFALGLAFALQQKPTYLASGHLEVAQKRGSIIDEPDPRAPLPLESPVVDTRVEALSSRELVADVVRNLQLVEDPEFNPALRKPGLLDQVRKQVASWLGSKAATKRARPKSPSAVEAEVVDAVSRNISVGRVGLTYVIAVSAESHDPAKAAAIANGIVDAYLNRELGSAAGGVRLATRQLRERVDALAAKLQQAEAAVARYRASTGLIGVAGATYTEQELSSLNQQLATAQAALAERQARVATAQRLASSGDASQDSSEVLTSEVMKDLRARQAESGRRVAELRARYGDRHPVVKDAEDGNAEIWRQIRMEAARQLASLSAEAQVAARRAAELRGGVDRVRGTLAGNNAASVRLAELEREAASIRTLYEALLARLRQANAREGTEVPDFKLLDKAVAPTSPYKPNLVLTLGVTSVLAVGAAVGTALIAVMLQAGLATGTEVEKRLGQRFLGSVPLVRSAAGREAAGVPPERWIVDNPYSVVAEAVRDLEASIFAAAGDRPVRTLAVTSALPGEGKTATTLSLGRSLALGGKRVVAVDCDLRRPSLHRVLAGEPKAGLTDVVLKGMPLADALAVDELSPLVLLPMRPRSSTPVDVLGHAGMAALLERLRSEFEIVLLDTGPVLPVANARVACKLADETLVVAKWRETPSRLVEAAIDLLNRAGARVAGVALSCVDLRRQAREGYGEGYYYKSYESHYA